MKSFEQEWPELSQRVRNSLAARGAPAWVRDDILQETALRLFRMWDRVDADRSPSGLALTIAHNLLWDEQHRKAPGELLGTLPDVPATQDVERSGIAREELGRVYRLLPRLKSNHRSVLLAEIGGPEPSTSSGDALKMLRLRARRRLTALMEGASAGIFAMLRRNSVPTEMSAGAVVAFCGMVAVLMVPLQASPAPSAETGDATGSRVVAQRLAEADELLLTRVSSATMAIRAGDVTRMRRDAETQPAGDRYDFSVGDEGPVNGEAGVQLLPKEDDQPLRPPGCKASRPRETEIVVSCTAHMPDRELKLKVRIAARP